MGSGGGPGNNNSSVSESITALPLNPLLPFPGT